MAANNSGSKFKKGDTVYYVGERKEYDNGDILLPGAKGEVYGKQMGCNEHLVHVRVDGRKTRQEIYPTYLSHSSPIFGGIINMLASAAKSAFGEGAGQSPAPRGFQKADTVYYVGERKEHDNGDILLPGAKGEVYGKQMFCNEHLVPVHFDGLKTHQHVHPTYLSHSSPNT